MGAQAAYWEVASPAVSIAAIAVGAFLWRSGAKEKRDNASLDG